MGFLILFFISVVSILGVNQIVKGISSIAPKIKIPAVLFLILIGILLSENGFLNLFGKIDTINPNINELQALASLAIVILFLVSGMQLNVPVIRKSGKKTLGLAIFPVFIEGIVMGFVSYLVLLILPGEQFKFNVIHFLMVMTVFAMASPAIIIPITLKAKSLGKKQRIYDEMTVASVLDNFTPFPLLILWITFGIALDSGRDVSISGLIVAVFSSMILFLLAYILGHIVGYISSYILKLDFMNSNLFAILLVIGTIMLVLFSGPLSSYAIIIGFGVGLGFNIGIKDNEKKTGSVLVASKIYNLLFMPLVFIYVGTKIQLNLLLNPVTILSMALITVIAITIKGFVSQKYLLVTGSSKDEAKLASYLFSAKGIILINISLVLVGIGYNQNVLQYMYVLAAVSIIISIPYSSIMAEKQIEKM